MNNKNINNVGKAVKEKLMSSRKFKYGSSAVVFTIVFVVIVLLVNALMSFVDC